MEENETSPPASGEAVEEAMNSDAVNGEGLPSESIEKLLDESTETAAEAPPDAVELAILEAIVYVTDEPLGLQQIANALGKPTEHVRGLLERLVAEYSKPEHGLMVREVAGGYKMATKPEHHEAVRAFVKNLNPPLKLSLAALETLAVIAYKQPITAPEIMEIRGVQGAGVLNTLLNRKLITASGRKNVVGRPILYKTTKEFMVQFGLKDLNELPTLKEFEDLRRMALGDEDSGPATEEPVPSTQDSAAGTQETAGLSEETGSGSGESSAQETDAPGEAPGPEPPNG